VQRSAILRDALGIGLATGAYGLSFGALAVAAGLTVPQACALSALMFTGASQFAFVGLIGGGAAAAAATALLLGARNGLYGLRLSELLDVRGPRRALAAQLVIDESTAMAVGRDSHAAARLGFWATGAAVFACWNLATLAGALAGAALSDPRALGLDAAAPAAFVALLAPRLDAREPSAVAVASAAAALVSVPLVPAGVPVLIAAAVAIALGGRRPREMPSSSAATPTSPPAAAAPSSPPAIAAPSSPPARA
jgi:predicted branched-subunit amino acid permease